MNRKELNEIVYKLLPEGKSLKMFDSMHEQARKALESGDYQSGERIYKECLQYLNDNLSSYLGFEWLSVIVQREQAMVLAALSRSDEAARLNQAADKICKKHVQNVLRENHIQGGTKEGKIIVEHVIPKLTRYIHLGRSFSGGLLYFVGVPFADLLQAAQPLGFEFFRGGRNGVTHFQMLNDCYHQREDTTFDGYVVLPPRTDLRISILALRTAYSSDVEQLCRRANQITGKKERYHNVFLEFD